MYTPNCSRIIQGSTDITKIYQGNTIVWQQSSGIADNEIWYTTNDGQVRQVSNPPYDPMPRIVSNVYSGGRGVITYEAPLTRIPDNYFGDEEYPDNRLTSVILPNCITVLDYCAFEECQKLEYVNIPTGVTTIDYLTFNNCGSLGSITIPNSVTSISPSAFNGCTGLTNITVEENNPVYDSRRNSNAIIETSTHTIIIGSNTTVIPNNVSGIESYAFYGRSITGITIPNSITRIVGNPFQNCLLLTSITVESNNPVYDSRGNCNAIIETATNTLVTGCNTTVIPNNVVTLGSNAFYGSGISALTIPNSVTAFGFNVFDYSRLTALTIPDSVVTLPSDGLSLQHMGSLGNLEIGNGITKISYYAFQYSLYNGIPKVTFGTGITKIGDYIFDWVFTPVQIYYKGTVAQWRAIEKETGWYLDLGYDDLVYCTDGTVRVSDLSQ